MTFLCIRPVCGKSCCDCNGAISPEQIIQYAMRYAYLRSRPVDTIAIKHGGVFAGMVPENLVMNEDDLDRAIDTAIEKENLCATGT